MKHIVTAIALSATLVSAGVLSQFEEKSRERENEKRVQFELEQMRIRANNGWTRNESGYQMRATYGGSITGTIVDSEGNPSLSGYVTLYDEYGHEYDNQWNGQAGAFVFTNVAPGKYTISEGHNGSSWYGDVTDANSAALFTVTGDEAKDIGTLTKSTDGGSQEYKTKVIQGTILNSGTPQANKSFQVRYISASPTANDWNHSEYIQTDINGKFSVALTKVIEGETFCLISSDRSNDVTAIAPLWIGGEALNESPTAITLPDTLKDVVIDGTTGGSIVGKVTEGFLEGDYCYFEVITLDGYVLDEAGAEQYNDSTFTITGLPAGEYYIRSASHYGYEEGFYPNSASFENAEKIVVVAGDETQISTTLTPEATTGADATLFITINDADGSPLKIEECEIITENGSSWASIMTSFAGTTVTNQVSVPVGVDARLEFTTKGIYSAPVSWEYTSSELSSGEEKTVVLTAETAGRVVGTYPLVQYESTNDISISEESYFTLMNGTDTISGSGGYPFSGKYSVGSAPAGEYTISMIPGIEVEREIGSSGGLTSQPVGPSASSSGTVTVVNGTTVVKEFESPAVSGMISGAINIEGSGAEAIYYAVSPEGKVHSWGWVECYDEAGMDKDKGSYKGLYSRNFTVYNSVNSGTSSSFSAVIDFPFLTAGDYYLYVAYWSDGIDDSDYELRGQWYGQTALSETNDYEHANFVIPSDAKRVSVPTDNSWVKDITFTGTSPIQDIAFTNRGGISQLVTTGKTISMSYNFGAPSATMNVYSLNGRRVISRNIDVSNSALSWSPNLAAGSYLVEIVAGSERLHVQPIILQ